MKLNEAKKRKNATNPWIHGVYTFLTGVEPAAYCLGGNRSILLSYRNMFYNTHSVYYIFCYFASSKSSQRFGWLSS